MSWKKTLATLAPTVATALGGPLAGMATKVVADKLGLKQTDPTKREAAIEAVIMGGDPTELAKVREAEQAFELEMERMGIERDKLNAQDRGNARAMAIAKGMGPQIMLSAIYTAGFFGLMYGVFFGHVTVDESMEPTMNILLGVLGAGQAQIMNFMFGSSSGSKAKTEKMGGA